KLGATNPIEWVEDSTLREFAQNLTGLHIWMWLQAKANLHYLSKICHVYSGIRTMSFQSPLGLQDVVLTTSPHTTADVDKSYRNHFLRSLHDAWRLRPLMLIVDGFLRNLGVVRRLPKDCLSRGLFVERIVCREDCLSRGLFVERIVCRAASDLSTVGGNC